MRDANDFLKGLTCCVALGAAACGSASSSSFHFVPGGDGKADGTGYEVRDSGPLTLDFPRTINAAAFVPALRVESFGQTQLQLKITGDDLVYVVAGPAADPDAAPDQTHIVAQGEAGTSAQITLADAGVYYVIAGPRATLTAGALPQNFVVQADAACTASCNRPDLPLAQFLAGAQSDGTLPVVIAQLTSQFSTVASADPAAAALVAKLSALGTATDFTNVEHTLTLPLQNLGSLRAVLGLVPASAPAPDQVINGELADLLGKCDAARSYPSVVTPAVPALGYGHFPDFSLNQCEITQSAQLAQVLTSLSVGNGSSVTYHGATAQTPKDLIQLLIASGHRVEIRNERAYANFVSFAYKQTNIRFPVWIDTGVAASAGGNIVIPVGHTQQSFYISGPDVDTRVAFYLGIDGAGFFSLTQRRPAWTGGVTYDIGSTDDGSNDRILTTLDFAMHYLQRTRVERTTVAAGMPADGYGYVGVCNDSVSLLESLTLGRATSYPLVRAKSLDTAPRLNDGLDDALIALPKDADDTPVRADILGRIRKMLPLDLTSTFFPDETLRAQMQSVDAEVNAK